MSLCLWLLFRCHTATYTHTLRGPACDDDVVDEIVAAVVVVFRWSCTVVVAVVSFRRFLSVVLEESR
jgi:hypothetical protein